MPTSSATSHYALGHTDAEHGRLIRQAKILAPLTERFFRQAGIGPGQHVLDLGSGVGDVAMLAAGLVGPSGKVLLKEMSRQIFPLRLDAGPFLSRHSAQLFERSLFV
jgi:protein-L-isoaspartate O-methyltransferase